MSKKITTQPTQPTAQPTHESDGRFALQMRTNKAVMRQMRRDAEREQRRREIEAEYGSDEMLWA